MAWLGRNPRRSLGPPTGGLCILPPNACWQLDATEYVLVGGRKCVIFQLQDDHSRKAIASHVAPSENGADAVAIMRKGITCHCSRGTTATADR